MKKGLGFGLLVAAMLVLASSCQNKNAASTDPAQNRYYSDYQTIYSGYGKIPAASTAQQLENYLNEFPENAEAWMLQGNIFYEAAHYPAAILSYRKALQLQPENAIFNSALGAVYTVQNNTDSAEKYLLKAVAVNDSSASAFLNLSLVYMKKQMPEKCFAFADSAYTKANSSVDVCAGLSFIYHQMQEEKRSSEMFQRTLALGLKDTIALRQLLEQKIRLEDFYRRKTNSAP